MLPFERIIKIFDDVPTVRRAFVAAVEVPSVMVPMFRLPLPVAFTKVRALEDTVPSIVVVMPTLPIVMPVAVEVPMEMVPALSIMTLPSPEMVVPLKVKPAIATDAPTQRRARQNNAPRAMPRLAKLDNRF